MELNLSLTRLSLFAGCIAIFWWLGGFALPATDAHGFHDTHRVAKAWQYCVVLFLTGAVNVSVIDHWVGTMDRSNIRLLYILLGAGMMIGSCFWLDSLRQSIAPQVHSSSPYL